MDKQRFDTFEKAIKTWGIDSQIGMLFEEMAELTIAINKARRATASENSEKAEMNIIEEIADVEIMLDQLKVVFRCEERVTEVYKIKLERLRRLLKI